MWHELVAERHAVAAERLHGEDTAMPVLSKARAIASSSTKWSDGIDRKRCLEQPGR
jgi:hypothetical protein